MTDSAIHPDNGAPTTATDKACRDAAYRIWHEEGRIEIDDNAKISRGCDNGAYVQAWVWVDDDDLEAPANDLEAPAGPSYDVWIAEPEYLDEMEWRFDQRFTCEDDPDGKGARRSAHEYARHLRNTYPCAFVAVRPSGQKPLDVRCEQ